MKKISLLFTILFISLISSACINNFAIQELNEIGKSYLDKGEIDNAISRFQSSVDLDENLFESRYNLGVAYIKKEDYENAIEHLTKASELKPDLADVHYSLAVALEGEASKLEDDSAFSDDTDIDDSALEDESIENEREISPDEAKSYLDLASKAIQEYKLYIKLAKNPDDKESVEKRIESIKKSMVINCEKYGINPALFPVDLEGVSTDDYSSAE